MSPLKNKKQTKNRYKISNKIKTTKKMLPKIMFIAIFNKKC